jgi:hypothetical protein
MADIALNALALGPWVEKTFWLVTAGVFAKCLVSLVRASTDRKDAPLLQHTAVNPLCESAAAKFGEIDIESQHDMLPLDVPKKAPVVQPKIRQVLPKIEPRKEKVLQEALTAADSPHIPVGKVNEVGLPMPYMAVSDGPLSLEKIDCEMKVKPVPKGCKVELYKELPKETSSPFYLYGPGWMDVVPGAHRNTANNESLSLCNRHVALAPSGPEVDIAWYDPTCALIRERIIEQTPPVKPINSAEWVQLQPPDKRAAYRKMLDTGSHLELTPKSHRRSFFIKNEILIPTAERPIGEKNPRGIQGAQDVGMNLRLGPYIQAIHKAVAQAFNDVDINQVGVMKWPRFGFTSGSSAERIGQWFKDMELGGYQFLEDDFSEYDTTQGQRALENERIVYYRLCTPSMEAKRELEEQDMTNGYGKFHRYSVPFTRKSGDQNTSIGNTLSNFVAHGSSLEQLAAEEGAVYDYFMLGLGDDNIVAIRRPGGIDPGWTNKLEERIKRTGFKPKLKHTTALHASYCSSRFMPAERNGMDTYVLCPDVKRMITKSGYSVRRLPKGTTPKQWLAANIASQPVVLHTPILRALYAETTKTTFNPLTNVDRHEESRVYDQTAIFHREAVEKWFCEFHGMSMNRLAEVESILARMAQQAAGKPFMWHIPGLLAELMG